MVLSHSSGKQCINRFICKNGLRKVNLFWSKNISQFIYLIEANKLANHFFYLFPSYRKSWVYSVIAKSYIRKKEFVYQDPSLYKMFPCTHTLNNSVSFLNATFSLKASCMVTLISLWRIIMQKKLFYQTWYNCGR